MSGSLQWWWCRMSWLKFPFLVNSLLGDARDWSRRKQFTLLYILVNHERRTSAQIYTTILIDDGTRIYSEALRNVDLVGY